MKTGKTKLKTSAGVLAQDPHRVQLDKERNLEAAIGKEVRHFRQIQRITVKELSDQTGLSTGMLSKIENGITSPSLTTLQLLANALGVPVTALFRRFEEEREAVYTKTGEGVEIVRQGTRAGHQYNLLGHIGANSSGVFTEPYLITLSHESDIFPTFQHDGLEFIYVLEGQVKYRHGFKLYHLEPGDTLYFDADAPHGPEELVELPVRFLSVISYSKQGGTEKV
ncbi:XRE family transcriptional regulator [Paracoccaceae bacterium]|jgi:transcriptional regulator with XRE-family HTH domain|nr:XRE family transcriptional regulator [Paracoccaceae bacterium]